jgi:transcriptional regulator with XRE-family HTH domain
MSSNFKIQVNDRNIQRVCRGRLFGSFIQHGREKTGLSVEEAARLAGTESREWQAVKGGEVPRPAQLLAIADSLEIDHDAMGSLAIFYRGAWEL